MTSAGLGGRRTTCRRRIVLRLCVFFIAGVLAEESGACGGEVIANYRQSGALRSSYCGINCIYGALKVVGVECEFASLVRPEFVSSPRGSTAADLTRAAEYHGASAKVVPLMTVSDLEASNWPVILHIASETNEYNHWVLYLGAYDGGARIVDVTSASRVLPFSELLARWDSTGIIVARTPREAEAATFSWADAILWAGLVGVIALLRIILPGRLTKRASPLTLCAVVIGACVLGAAYHWVTRDGLLRNSAAVEIVRGRYHRPTVAIVSSAEMISAVREASAVIIDARMSADYASGHIPNAISIPISLSARGRAQILKNRSKDSRLVIYCLNAECEFGETIMRRLHSDGFTNIALFSGGWVEWQKIQGPSR